MTISDDLAKAVDRQLPDVNFSALLQGALRRALRCEHFTLVCATCAEGVSAIDLQRLVLNRFYLDAMDAIEQALWSGRTVEGVARAVKDAGERNQIPVAKTRPLPRLSRAAHVATAKTRHPSAHQPTEEHADVQPAAAVVA